MLKFWYLSGQVPRNTDQDAWADPFSMNLHFQVNLTAGDHVVAAKLRIYKLPQENLTTSVSGTFEDEEEDEKKIRISIYYYTKSLKKHRCEYRTQNYLVKINLYKTISSNSAKPSNKVMLIFRFQRKNA